MAKLTTEEFITKAKIKHGNVYDYSYTQYINSAEKVAINCRLHGIFNQLPNNHLLGKGCPECGRIKTNYSMTRTTPEFIEEATKVHKGRYDYSSVIYLRGSCKVEIKCSVHGIFEQTPNTHLRGANCPKCNRSKLSEALALPWESFLARYTEKFGEFPFRLISEYSSLNKTILLEDREGIVYKTKAKKLLTNGELRIQNVVDKNFYSIKRFRSVHGDKYNYEKVHYSKAISKITVNCPIHGDFKISPEKHLNGCGCPPCGRLKTTTTVQENPTGWNLTNWAIGAGKSKRFDTFKVYFIRLKNTEEEFYKIGRTYYTMNARMRHIPYLYEVISIISHDDPKIIFDLENHLKRTFKAHKYKPLKPFGGQHECFKFDDPTIQSVLREMTLPSTNDIIPTSTK